MNCDNPTIAVRRAGVNPLTGKGYKPHVFYRFHSDEVFVDLYFKLKADSDSRGDTEVLILPCSKCLLCVQAKRREWTCRCINECQVSHGGVFLTLTCSDDSIVRTFPNGSLDHRPWQLFMKRLKKGCRMVDVISRKPVDRIRFMMCGEYGERTHRPHYHALLFGVDFPDRYFVGRSDSGLPLYSSTYLDDCRIVDGVEVFGPVSNFADLTPYDIAYTCGYVDKKLGLSHSQYYNLHGIKPEYTCMSRNPGIGFDWLSLYHGDIWKFYQDTVISDRVFATPDFGYKVPRFYNDKAKSCRLISDQKFDIIRSSRQGRVLLGTSDPVSLAESLKRAHDKCVIEKHRLDVISAPRQF